MKAYSGMEINSFQTSAMDVDKCSASRPGHFNLGKRYQLCRKPGGRFGEDKNLLILLGFKPRIIHPAVYAD